MASALNVQTFEGAFAQPNPYWQPAGFPPYPAALAGAGGLVAGAGGLIQGRFGWGNPTTLQTVNQPSAGAVLGVVVPIVGWRATWGRVFFDCSVPGGAWRIRQGLPVTLCVGGPFWLRFAAGAVPGQRVYADPVDGHAISGNTGGGAVLTPWTVVTPAGPWGLAIVSSTADVGA